VIDAASHDARLSMLAETGRGHRAPSNPLPHDTRRIVHAIMRDGGKIGPVRFRSQEVPMPSSTA
jgi:hypothetical protein